MPGKKMSANTKTALEVPGFSKELNSAKSIPWTILASSYN
jgi:hypothetical protein